MLACWDGDPKLRPTFEDLCKGVNDIIVNMERVHQEVGFSATYINVPVSQHYLYPKNSRHSLEAGNGLYPKYSGQSETSTTASNRALYAKRGQIGATASNGALYVKGLEPGATASNGALYPRRSELVGTGASNGGLYPKLNAMDYSGATMYPQRRMESSGLAPSISAGLYPQTMITNATSKSTLV